MKIKLRATMAGPDGCFGPGDIIDVSELQGQDLLTRSYAEPAPPDDLIKHLSYIPWPETGCTLQEALHRTADPDLWDAVENAERELSAAGGRGSRKVISAGLIPGTVEMGEMSPKERERRRLLKTTDVAWHASHASFYRELIEARLIAVGAKNCPSDSPKVIPSRAWEYMKVRSWNRSIAIERTKERVEWFGVRIVPTLHASNAADSVSDLPLSTVFKKFVLEDPEVRALAKRALTVKDAAKSIFDEGKLGRGLSEYQWPVSLDGFENPAQVFMKYRSFYEKPVLTTPQGQSAGAALWDRYARLLELCKRVGLRGTVASTGEIREIDSVQLSRPSAWIDMRNGDLLEEVSDSKFEARWIGLSFLHKQMERAPVQLPQGRLFHGKATEYDGVPPSTTKQQKSLTIHAEASRPPAGSRRKTNRPSPKSERVAAALKMIGINIATTDLSLKEIAGAIAHILPVPPRTDLELEALAKRIARLRAKSRNEFL